jgi:putative ABC transport system substrate-binding protein
VNRHRRRFVGAAAALAGIASRRVRAQAVPKIGFLGNASATTPTSQLEALRHGLRDAGWIEGRDYTLVTRWADGDLTRLPSLATELVAARVDVIVLSGPLAIRAASDATKSIPIVFVVLSDPVSHGFVQSLARPGGNMTGLASQYDEVVAKQLQLLKEALPTLSRVALLRHAQGSPAILAAAESAARKLGLAARTLTVADVAAFEGAFRTARSERVGAMHVLPSPYLGANRAPLIALASQYRLPAFYELRTFVEEGGLMSYGPNIYDLYQRSAGYAVRILKGADPASMAIERAARFEFVINRRTAAALGVAIPPSLLQRADEVIA